MQFAPAIADRRRVLQKTSHTTPDLCTHARIPGDREQDGCQTAADVVAPGAKMTDEDADRVRWTIKTTKGK